MCERVRIQTQLSRTGGRGGSARPCSAVPSSVADNNITELIAVFIVLFRHPRHARLAIHTDSRACMTTLEGGD